MVYEKGVNFDDVQSGNWNVAQKFVNDKVHKYLVLIDNYKDLAVFGFSHIESDITISNNSNLKNTARLYALKRLINAILSLISNTKFAIKKESKTVFTTYSARLLKIEKYIPKLRIVKKRGQKIVELNLNENIFEKIMFEINDMVDDIYKKLNEADLIFAHTEEFDVEKAKQRKF